MGIFDNASSLTINNKEVSSIKIGNSTLYEVGEKVPVITMAIHVKGLINGGGIQFDSGNYSVYIDGVKHDSNGSLVFLTLSYGNYEAKMIINGTTFYASYDGTNVSPLIIDENTSTKNATELYFIHT